MKQNQIRFFFKVLNTKNELVYTMTTKYKIVTTLNEN